MQYKSVNHYCEPLFFRWYFTLVGYGHLTWNLREWNWNYTKRMHCRDWHWWCLVWVKAKMTAVETWPLWGCGVIVLLCSRAAGNSIHPRAGSVMTVYRVVEWQWLPEISFHRVQMSQMSEEECEGECEKRSSYTTSYAFVPTSKIRKGRYVLLLQMFYLWILLECFLDPKTIICNTAKWLVNESASELES